jgi:hypothetical protein
MNCPDCESPLSYPEKCPCGWFATVKYDLPNKADEVRQQITNAAKRDAIWKTELAGSGQREYEPGFVDYWRKKALTALKTMRLKKICE